MTRERIYGPLLAAILGVGALAAGCGSEPGLPLPNQAPNTRISSGPPELGDTSFPRRIKKFRDAPF